MPSVLLVLGLVTAGLQLAEATPHRKPGVRVQLGPRPYWLVDDMDSGTLKDKLASCSEMDFRPSAFSIGHRGGGTLFIPEETVQSNKAGQRMGAGVLECDVVFTSDRELVCRHDQCDLHTTTNIVNLPALNAKCTQPFKKAEEGKPASAKCCTSDITLAEFKTLCGKMDGFNASATTPAAFLRGTPNYRTDLYATCGTVMTHKESDPHAPMPRPALCGNELILLARRWIVLVDSMGLQFTPELKTPQVPMPFKGGNYTQARYAQQMIDEYKAAKIDPKRVWPQSFLYDDILYWLQAEPSFGKQAVYLDENGDTPETYVEAVANLTRYARDGVKIVAPPLYYLVSVGAGGRIVPSGYAAKAKSLGLSLITWTFERSGLLGDGSHGGYYYTSIANVTNNDGDAYQLLDVLARDVGVLGVFSDWSASVTYYANCFGLFP